MNTFKVILEIDRVGDKEALAALDTLAAKSKVASSSHTGLTAATKEASHAFGEHGKAINKIGRAMESLATETIGAKSQVGMMAGELAKMTLGGAWMLGITAGIAAIGFAYEKLTEKTKEAKKAQEELIAKIAEAANAGTPDVIRGEARKLLFGQPFDKEGKLVANSQYAKGAFEGSLLDLQGKLRSLTDQFYTTTNGFAQIAIQKQIIAVKAQLKPMEDLMARLQSAGANVATQPAGNAGQLPNITTTAQGTSTAIGKGLGTQVADAYQKELAKDLAAATKLAVAQGVESAELSYQARNGILDGLLPTRDQIAAAVRDIGEQISEAIANDPILIRAKMAKDMGEQMGRMLSDGIAGSLVQALDAGFEKAFSGSGAVGFIKGFGQAVLGALGGIMEQMGAALISYGIAMELVAHGLTNPFTSGPAAIAAGTLLVGLGAALSAAVSGHGSRSVGSGGYSGTSGLSGIIDRGVINPDTYSSRSPSSYAPRGGDTFVFYGANDPQAVRWLDEMDRKRQQRGSLVPARA